MTLLELFIENGAVLEQRGNRHWCRCPFHQDTAPSLSISKTDTGYVWYCFGCGKGGGPVQFLMETLDIPEWEARRKWDAMNGREEIDDDRTALSRFVGGLSFHTYLGERGISDVIAGRFRVGYCDDYDDLLSKSNVSRETAGRIGLWDVSGHIVYPFFDKDGVYKIAARSVKEKNYKTSPSDSEYFKIGLWGLQNLRGKEAWIFEGFHDTMVAFQAGYPAVAACGCHMKPEMWTELRNAGVTKAVFVPDGDAGGLRWIEELVQNSPNDISIEIVVLSSGDPDDEILQHGSLNHLKRWNPFEWWITSKYGSPSTVADHVRMLENSRKVFFRMPAVDRAVARKWYREAFADDESLACIQEDLLSGDVEAERVVLANCLYSQPAKLEACNLLEAGYFTGKIHQRIFELCAGEITPQLVYVECGADLSAYADIVNYRTYIDKVLQVGRSRKISRVLREADLQNPGGIIDDIYKVTDKVTAVSGVSLVHEVVNDIKYRIDNPGVPGVEISTFPTLNRCLLGLQPEKYILLSGNSGHGKTTTLCNIMNDVIDDHNALMFSLEMTDKEIMHKLIAIRSGVPSIKLQTGSLTQEEHDSMMKSADTLLHGNLEIVTGVSDLRKIIAISKSHLLRRKVRFVFLDYLQLVRLSGNKDDRWEQLIMISEGMKEIARLGPTVIALSQLNAHARSSKIADAGDQAGSYGIIAPTDYALTVQKLEGDNKEFPGCNYLLNVSKSRFGWDNVRVGCIFDRNLMRITEQVG